MNTERKLNNVICVLVRDESVIIRREDAGCKSAVAHTLERIGITQRCKGYVASRHRRRRPGWAGSPAPKGWRRFRMTEK